MDPAETIAGALSGTPRTSGAKQSATAAPTAARWLQHPTPHSAKPETGSYDWWMQLLLSWGRIFDEDDARLGIDDEEDDDAPAKLETRTPDDAAPDDAATADAKKEKP